MRFPSPPYAPLPPASPTSNGGEVLSRRRYCRILWSLFFLYSLRGLLDQLPGDCMSLLIAQFDIPRLSVAIGDVAVSLTEPLGSFCALYLIRTYRPKMILIVSLLIMFYGTLACAMVPYGTMLYIMSQFVYLGYGGAVVVTSFLVTQLLLPSSNRLYTLCLLELFLGLGSLLSPIVAWISVTLLRKDYTGLFYSLSMFSFLFIPFISFTDFDFTSPEQSHEQVKSIRHFLRDRTLWLFAVMQCCIIGVLNVCCNHASGFYNISWSFGAISFRTAFTCVFLTSFCLSSGVIACLLRQEWACHAFFFSSLSATVLFVISFVFRANVPFLFPLSGFMLGCLRPILHSLIMYWYRSDAPGRLVTIVVCASLMHIAVRTATNFLDTVPIPFNLVFILLLILTLLLMFSVALLYNKILRARSLPVCQLLLEENESEIPASRP